MRKLLVVLAVLVLSPARSVHADVNTDHAERAVVMLEEIATIVDTNKDNCDAMGDKLTAYLDKNADKLNKLKAAGKKLTDKQKQDFSEKYKDRMKAVSAKMTPGMQKCAKNQKVADAMKKATAK